MYTRTMRVGEYVDIAGHLGRVENLGIFTTRVRTGQGDELTLPNSLVMANVTRNYSRGIAGRGFVLDADVTAGYDTPWRLVHAMLAEAAYRTAGVAHEPPPQVLQLALSDFHPRYRLVCRAESAPPGSRSELLGALHANIQDVFNENGVPLLSPHYLADPQEAKIVPPSRWSPGLARRAASTGPADADGPGP